MKVISVFGSASPVSGSADYLQAESIGRLLAQNGYAVATGGYVGTMEAVSKGASEAGGHVIGVTCTAIEDFRPIAANQWVAEEIKFDTLRERMLHLVMHNEGAIVLPGGIGTLVEMALMWNLLQVDEIPARPFITLGDIWRDTLNAFVKPEYVKPQYHTLVQHASTPQEAVTLLVNGH